MGKTDVGDGIKLSDNSATGPCQAKDYPQTENEPPVQSEYPEKPDDPKIQVIQEVQKSEEIHEPTEVQSSEGVHESNVFQKSEEIYESKEVQGPAEIHESRRVQKSHEERALLHSDQMTYPPAETKESASDRKKEDEKLSIYKALAIKLKKELVKSRDELQKLYEDSNKECSILKQKVQSLETSLETTQQTSATTIISLESRIKSLREQLESSEFDLQTLQNDFENYKVRASKIMQANNPTYSASDRTIEENRYKQLKELNDNHLRRISTLESQLSASLDRNCELEKEGKLFEKEVALFKEEVESLRALGDKCETLSRENDNLKVALKQFRNKLKELSHNCDENHDPRDIGACESTEQNKKLYENNVTQATASGSNLKTDQVDNLLPDDNDQFGENGARSSPSVSVRDDSQTNSSSSYDESTSGYVHIKPATFEIISRSSILEDTQNQIDSLTKAYLDSENTNALLSDQIRALKEEIRRLQRGTERMELAENLEYLKNVVFKFLSLDSSQLEQKQQLVPVLSTVLRLSPEETRKLNSLATIDKPSMASSFFKL